MALLSATVFHRRFFRRLLGGCFAALATGAAAPATEPVTPPQLEYQIKAVFLLNFARFVEWPASAFAAPDAPLEIGVLGHDPFGAYLDDAVRGESVDRRPIVVRRFRSIAELRTCHVLFISRSEADHLEPILSRLKGRDILTVSDADHFATNGGMIGLVKRNDKVRLQINLDAAKDSALAISSKLLRPSEVVGSWKKHSLPWTYPIPPASGRRFYGRPYPLLSQGADPADLAAALRG